MATGVDYNLLQNGCPKNWTFEYNRANMELKISYLSKYFAADEAAIKWIFHKKNLPQAERDKVLTYFAHYVKSITIENKTGKGSGTSKQTAAPRKKETTSKKKVKDISSSSSSTSSLKGDGNSSTYRGKLITEYSDKELLDILKDLGLPYNVRKDEKMSTLRHYVEMKKKVPKQLKEGIGESDVDHKSKDGSNDVSNELTMRFAVQSNKGNRGRRRYIDNDEKEKKKKKTDAPKTNYRNIEHDLEVGVIQYFAGVKKGNKGINKAVKSHSKRPSIFPTQREISKFKSYVSIADPNYHIRQEHVGRIASDSFREWLWLTQLNFNVLVYGIGDKVSLVREFGEKMLYDEDVIAVDGWSSSSVNNSNARGKEGVVKELLDTIWAGIINPAANINSSTSASMQPVLDQNIDSSWSLQRYVNTTIEALHAHYSLTGKELFGRDLKGDRLRDNVSNANNISALTQESRQHRLYILIYGIDGVYLSSPLSQEILSRLATCRVISIISYCDHVNTPLMWSHEMLTRFRWTYHHISTYDCFDISEEFQNKYCASRMTSGNTNNRVDGPSDETDYARLEFLLRSLTPTHHKVIYQMVALEVARRDACSKRDENRNEGSRGNVDFDDDPPMGHGKWDTRGIILNGLFDTCKSQLIVHNLQSLTQHLRELLDHKWISIQHKKVGSSYTGLENTVDYVLVHLPTQVLKTMVTKNRSS